MTRRQVSGSRPRACTALLLQELESRLTPATEWALPAGGGVFDLSVQSQDLLLERDGVELFRTSANGADIVIRGNAEAESIHANLDGIDAAANLRVSLDGGGGDDSLQLACGPLSDPLTGGPGWIRAASAGAYDFEANGFASIDASASSAAPISATIEGSSGHDSALLNGQFVQFGSTKPGWITRLEGFVNVALEGGPGDGYDQVEVRDSIGSDDFVYSSNSGTLKRDDGIEHSFANFDLATLIADTGRRNDRDVISLTDSPAAETFRTTRHTGIFFGGDSHFQLILRRPDVVNLDGNAGGLNVRAGSKVGYELNIEGFRNLSKLRFGYQLSRSMALHWMKRIALRIDPQLGEITDRLELVIHLRDFVHHRVRIGSNSSSWPAYDAYERFLKAIVSQQEPVLCQGMSWLYRDLLNAFGVGRVREVSLFSSTFRPNHSSVEVWLDNHWVAMDPTFNVSFTGPDGERISLASMRKTKIWTPQFDGKLPRDGRVIDVDFVVPYARYLYRLKYPPLHR